MRHFVVFPAAYQSFSNGVFNSAVYKARNLAANVPDSNVTCFLNRSKFGEHNHKLGITQYFAPASTKEDKLNGSSVEVPLFHRIYREKILNSHIGERAIIKYLVFYGIQVKHEQWIKKDEALIDVLVPASVESKMATFMYTSSVTTWQ